MIDAFIICDFNNPLSMRYLELSLKSFEPVSDIVNITPVQCTTPDTLPIRFEKNQEPIPFYVAKDGVDYLHARFFGGTFCDHEIHNSIMHSQFVLIERIAKGEPIAIMEHDAALINEDSFRYMIDQYWGEVDIFMPGTCMEFYGLSQRYAEKFVELMYNFPYTDNRVSGPFGAMLHLETRKDLLDFDGYEVLCPTKGRADLDKICLSSHVMMGSNGAGYELIDPACKQYFFRSQGNTNVTKYKLDENIFETMKRIKEEDNHTSLNIDPSTGPTWSRDFVVIDD